MKSIRGSSLLPLLRLTWTNRHPWYINLKKENASRIFPIVGLYGIVGKNDVFPVDDEIVAMVKLLRSG